jgi:hypothetical protein
MEREEGWARAREKRGKGKWRVVAAAWEPRGGATGV